jgi:hypothetical protein
MRITLSQCGAVWAFSIFAKLAAAGAVGWVVASWGVGYRLAP